MATSAYTVEKGVSLPQRAGKGRPFIYPFREMAIGDSFLVPCPGDEVELTRRRLCGAWNRVVGRKFTARLMTNGLRVWRVK